jgi:hypothetical protein
MRTSIPIKQRFKPSATHSIVIINLLSFDVGSKPFITDFTGMI